MSKLAVSVTTLIVFVSLMITLVWAIVWKPDVTSKVMHNMDFLIKEKKIVKKISK